MGYEIDFLPVGNSNGDAICLRYGGSEQFWVHVIDGAFKETGGAIVNHIHKHYGPHVHINHMVLSHADNDHAPGLAAVLEAIPVRTLWMNARRLTDPGNRHLADTEIVVHSSLIYRTSWVGINSSSAIGVRASKSIGPQPTSPFGRRFTVITNFFNVMLLWQSQRNT
jgi:hypothetical protein